MAASKKVRIKGGAFKCPICRTGQNHYELKRQWYKTFFFIPLYPIDMPEDLDMIECAGCGSRSDEAVLNRGSSRLAKYENQKPPRPDGNIDLASTSICPRCGRENSIHTKVCPRCEARLVT